MRANFQGAYSMGFVGTKRMDYFIEQTISRNIPLFYQFQILIFSNNFRIYMYILSEIWVGFLFFGSGLVYFINFYLSVYLCIDFSLH